MCGDRVRMLYAIHAPLIPEPMIAISVSGGSSAVERRSAIPSGGSCQYDVVGFSHGSVTGIKALSSMAARICMGIDSGSTPVDNCYENLVDINL